MCDAQNRVANTKRAVLSQNLCMTDKVERTSVKYFVDGFTKTIQNTQNKVLEQFTSHPLVLICPSSD